MPSFVKPIWITNAGVGIIVVVLFDDVYHWVSHSTRMLCSSDACYLLMRALQGARCHAKRASARSRMRLVAISTTPCAGSWVRRSLRQVPSLRMT